MVEMRLDKDCEIIWVKLQEKGATPLFIGAFYHPTDTNTVPIDNLYSSLQKLVIGVKYQTSY